MERAAPHVTGWPAEILGSGYRDMPDAATRRIGLGCDKRRG